ncbi:resolvase domain protein [Peptoclostridium acidaminophilum DSM 3953]|uniref:Resolvase domain protein n=1 Tax=Peptoclostridium acidaminophilum DSM 3953 TaxID=1286171 RepID=W8T8N9_PEPAC|nr:recombinase family protein [Peptoclostridium acidaminophilum]AHM57225.1 resolvase domain protein [Peptoclostridium acidaminophilum DSM 3953]
MSANQNQASMSPRVRVIPAQGRTDRNKEHYDGRKKRIAAYARVSTLEEHQSSSYELQVAYYTEYIQKNPAWEFYKVFADEGISGTSIKNRTGFQEMIQAAKDGKIDYIITKSISRFARNTLDCISTVRLLKNLPKPCGVFFEKENIDTLDGKSELLLALLASTAEEESKNISMNTIWGVQKRFSQGHIHCPTVYFMGYDTDEDGNIVINEEQARIVKRIFKEYLEGKGTLSIAKGLMKDGILTARGNAVWTSYSVYLILKNEKYMGHCLAQKTVTIDYLSHKRVINRNHQPQYYIKNCLPAIISEDDWNAVQRELKRRKSMLINPKGKYAMNYSNVSPFSNKLFCGNCGRPVTRRRITSRRKGEKYYYSAWHCKLASQKIKTDEKCGSKYVSEDELEKAIMKMLYDLKENNEDLMQDANQAIYECSLTQVEEERLEELKKQIEAVTDKISELASRESSGSSSIYDATLRHLIYEQEILQMECEGLEKNRQDSIYLKKHLEELLECLDEIEGPAGAFRGDIFKRVVESGTLNENYEIAFKLKCGISRTAFASNRKKINSKK